VAVAKGRTSVADRTSTLKVGDTAPAITLPAHNADTPWSLADAKGRSNVLLAFFPFAYTPTCSTQIPSYEQHLARFVDANTQVVGISTDTKPSLKAWADGMGGITFPLLSDFWPHGAVAQAYGVFREAQGMTERAVFVIDKSGVIRYIDVHELREQPDEEQIFEVLKGLG
jgi:peroxiredoxin